MDSAVQDVRNNFNRIYLGGIPLLMGNAAFLSFICILTAVEALAGYRYPESGKTARPGERFQRFVQAYFPGEYHGIAGDLWDFRNGMIHSFSPRRFALFEHRSHLHLQKTGNGATALNAEDFYAALLQSSKRYFAELETEDELQRNFWARLKSVQGGGINVGPIEVG